MPFPKEEDKALGGFEPEEEKVSRVF